MNDYEQTVKYFHELAAVRFKLLDALPTVTGAAAAILQSQRAEIAASISAFGLLAAFGITMMQKPPKVSKHASALNP